MSRFVRDRKSQLFVSQSLATAETQKDHLAWLEAVTRALTAAKIKWNLSIEEAGIAVQRHLKGRSAEWLVFNASVAMVDYPPVVWVQQVGQWFDAKLDPAHVYRSLSRAEQVRVSNRTGKEPSKSTRNAMDLIDKEHKRQADLRRQGFDPQKEDKL